MLEYLEKFFLLFGQEYSYIVLMIVGFVVIRRRVFAQSMAILFFTMILNIVLKNIFKVPLNPVLNIQGYAFPSGHMTSAVAFYGWLAVNSRYNLLRILIVIMLLGIGSALIYFQYHYLIDIIASIAFGIIIISLSYILAQWQMVQRYPYLFSVFLWLLTIPLIVTLHIMEVNSIAWPSMASLGLAGFSFSWSLYNKYLDISQSKLNIFINLIIATMSIITVKYADYLFKEHFEGQSYLVWFLVGFSLPLSVRICHLKKVLLNCAPSMEAKKSN